MRNEKGHMILGLAYVHLAGTVLTVTAFKMAFLGILAAAIWHMPAWDEAKDNHTEAVYQNQQMFPQQLFSMLPGGSIKLNHEALNGNGGNLTGGIQVGG